MFKHKPNTVSESAPAGTVVGRCRIHPQKTYGVITLDSEVEPLAIETRTGEVYLGDEYVENSAVATYYCAVLAYVDGSETQRTDFTLSNLNYGTAAPSIDGVPLIVGTIQVGETVTITPAIASGVPAPVVTLQMKRGGELVGSPVGELSYTFDEGDLGFTFTVVEVADNGVGTAATAESATTAAVIATDQAPVIDGVPTITGAAQVDQVLTAVPASVTSALAVTRTWQWLLDDVDIGGATSINYTPVTGDIGGVITVEQTETNAEGADVAVSAGTAAVIAATPLDALPVITSNGGGSTALISVPENSVLVTTVTATEAYPVVYSISGGADAADFSIDPSSGALTFNVTPDYASPHDSDTNNTYVVDVTATAGDQSDTQTITITITEAAGATLGPELWPIPDFTSPVGLTSSGSPTWTVTGGTATASTGNSSMSISGVCTVGRTYRHTVTISSYTSGSLRYGWTGSDITLASGVGTYSIDKVADGTAINVGSASFVGAINSYSCKEVL